MAKRSTNRIKLKVWDEKTTMEFDGSIDEGLYYAAWSLSVEDRKILIEKLVDQQGKVQEMKEKGAA